MGGGGGNIFSPRMICISILSTRLHGDFPDPEWVCESMQVLLLFSSVGMRARGERGGGERGLESPVWGVVALGEMEGEAET